MIDQSLSAFNEVIEVKKSSQRGIRFAQSCSFSFLLFSKEFDIKRGECGWIVGCEWLYSLSRFTKRITTPWNVSNKEIGIAKASI